MGKHSLYYAIALLLVTSLIAVIVGTLLNMLYYLVPLSTLILIAALTIATMVMYNVERKLLKIRDLVNTLVKIGEDNVRLTTIKPKRKRYIVFEILYDGRLSFEDVNKLITDSFKELFGIYGISEYGVKLIYYDSKLNRGVLRTDNLSKNAVIAGLTFIKEHDNKPISIYPIRTTGTLRKAKEVLNMLRTG